MSNSFGSEIVYNYLMQDAAQTTPKKTRLTRKEDEEELLKLQIELCKLQEWVRHRGMLEATDTEHAPALRHNIFTHVFVRSHEKKWAKRGKSIFRRGRLARRPATELRHQM